MSLTKPTQIAVPFAASGSKTAIPATANNVTGRAGYDAGFPAITRIAKAAGGIPPFGTDFNGIFYDAFAAIQYLEAGGAFPYDSTFATAIGGYPVGALVSRSDGMGLWKNLVAGNTTNPDDLGAGWDTLDSGITFISMTNTNVTLIASQAARNVIIISGTLTANLDLIFPKFNKTWLVVNNSTGSFKITCKTSAGSAVSFSSGDSCFIFCDGANILTSIGNSNTPIRAGAGVSKNNAVILGQFLGGATSSSYIKIPFIDIADGVTKRDLIIQWGVTTVIPSGSVGATTTFPIAFPTICAQVVTNYGNATSPFAAYPSNLISQSTTGFTITQQSTGVQQFTYIAIGF